MSRQLIRPVYLVEDQADEAWEEELAAIAAEARRTALFIAAGLAIGLALVVLCDALTGASGLAAMVTP